jgi:GT2 family glycosyltransferase
VILVNYNGRAFIEECLDSLVQDSDAGRLEIFVVDNGSSDGSPELISKKYPKVILLRNAENRGYAWANNKGIRAARGDYILLLNTDTTMQPGVLFELVKVLKSDPNAAAVGPLLYYSEGKHQVSFGEKVDFMHEMLQKSILNFVYKKRLKSLHGNLYVGWLSGACMLLEKKALKNVGYFDDKFFLYFEDIDLCYRLRKKKYKLIFTPSVQVYHKGGGSSAADSLKNRFFYRQSQLYFYRKHNSKMSLSLLKTYLSVIFFLSYLKSCLGREKQVKEKMNFFKLLRMPDGEKDRS